ncbi:MAG TPA: MSMEG_6728 family protein [Frankiaceae bacterium]|nr:MSMEG_6728 family protein [Frankiaceae bacterium]
MQTFLPYADFERSARALDDRRLGKQRVEALQILRAVTIPTYGWQHHPAVNMWRGHVEALATYGVMISREWVGRGRADTCAAQIAEFAAGRPLTQRELARRRLLPPWLGDEAFHLAHRSSLLRKDPDWYRPIFGDVPEDLPYVWPTKANGAAAD